MFSASHTDPPIVGASDIGHGFYWLTTSDRTRESNPGPTKYSCCKGRESNPGPTKISCARVSRKISRSRTKNTDRARDFHVERVHRMTDDGQTDGRRPDRPNFWIWAKKVSKIQRTWILARTSQDLLNSRILSHVLRSCRILHGNSCQLSGAL